MDYELYKITILAAVILLILGLVFRIRKTVQGIVKSEIYTVFPSIKSEIENLAQCIGHLKAQIDEMENKLKGIKDRSTQ